MIKTCKICGKEFETTRNNRIYCSNECQERAIKKRAEKLKLIKNPAKPKRNTMGDLKTIAIEAREHNMSYGQYVAMREDK